MATETKPFGQIEDARAYAAELSQGSGDDNPVVIIESKGRFYVEREGGMIRAFEAVVAVYVNGAAARRASRMEQPD